MRLNLLAGNPRLKEQLSRQGAGRGLSHAYIISGPAGSGKHTLARLLAGAMVCAAPAENAPCGVCLPCKKVVAGTHPDVTVIAGPGEGKPITVDQIRALRTDAHIRPNEGERKVYVLEGADGLNPSAQNAMLKLLEEGPAYAAFLLLAENPGGLLQTVRSRCEELPLSPVPPAQCREWLRERYPGRPPEELEKAALDCQGILGRAVAALEGADTGALEAQAKALSAALARGSERQVLEAAMELEKSSKESLSPLLERTGALLVEEMARGGDKRRCLRAVELLRRLKGAAALNVGPGALWGWLCGGLFI